jgi:hypothetical protein
MSELAKQLTVLTSFARTHEASNEDCDALLTGLADLEARLAAAEGERDGYKAMVCSQSCKMHYPPPDGEPLPWDELQREVERLREALGWYAGRRTAPSIATIYTVSNGDVWHCKSVPPIMRDKGKCARTALATEGEKDGTT